MGEAPELGRALFGYRKQDVESILDVRERMFEKVSEEATRREEEAGELRRDLDRARQEARSARDESQTVRAELNRQLNEVLQELEALRRQVGHLEALRREAESRAAALETELRDARSRATDLETELRDTRREATLLGERVSVADATETDLRRRLDEAILSPSDQPQELGSVLEATQQAIARLMAGARRTAEDDLARVLRTRNEIQSEIDRVRSWRQRIEPVTQGIAGDIAAAQTQLSQATERVGEAFRPITGTLSALGRRLDELASVVDPDGIGTERPDRVDLVSHEQEQAARTPADQPTDQKVDADVGASHQLATGAGLRPEPWPDRSDPPR